MTTTLRNPGRLLARSLRSATLAWLCVAGVAQAQSTPVNLADQPVFSQNAVPGNLALALSVEFPTASTPAYFSSMTYSTAQAYVGYFDPTKCYEYVRVDRGAAFAAPARWAASYFRPRTMTSSTFTCVSTAALPLWSGNYLNWATMQTLDIFRWTLTGGSRGTFAAGLVNGFPGDDTASSTILSKTNHTGQGAGYFPNKSISAGVNSVSPFNFGTLVMQANGGTGNSVYFYNNGANGAEVYYNNQNAANADSLPNANERYRVFIRVRVCDATSGLALESNCVSYPGGNYKPEGLMQKYSSKLRYSAFGYLNDDAAGRDGGVMRARMKYIGRTKPVPGSADVVNTTPEWNADGTFILNPDATDAAATTTASTAAGFAVSITNSGVMNYLNKFGSITGLNYKSFDPVSELYYAATRYLRNVGNVPEYSSLAGAGNVNNMTRWLDGFPVIQTWDDPILYSCQKNFILGIGDVNTWNDTNLKGSTFGSGGVEPAMPSAVASDPIDVKAATDLIGRLEGTTNTLGSTYINSGRKDAYFMAGIAYHVHTNDIRADLDGKQTISTYWLDVKEGQTYSNYNVYYYATKYGGFEVPENFVAYPSTVTAWGAAQQNWWHTSNENLSAANKRPDNYFVADQGLSMVKGLTDAFEKIANEASKSVSTAFSVPTPRQTANGNYSYSATYNPADWTGQLIGYSVAYDAQLVPTYSQRWDARDSLNQRTAANRIIVTCCKNDGTAMPFQPTDLANTSFPRTNYASFSSVSGVSSSLQSQTGFLNYLRGDRTLELASNSSSASSSSASSLTKRYRAREHLLGDVVNSQVTAVGAPDSSFFDSYNPGYSAFKVAYANRKTVVYVGANDGMLHAFDGTIPASAPTGTCASGGQCGYELFAYIPSFLYGTGTDAAANGLAALGNPGYTHRFYVDSTPKSFDLDFNRAGTNALAGTSDWRTILIGGLGKGGKGYYGIDITNPATWTSESAVASKVLWEFTHANMGYSYGEPLVVKTKKYGWTAVFTSGYNNADGRGYFFFVNPKTGELLETVVTPTTVTGPLNLSGPTAFRPDGADNTADAIYAGDLQGNVWRVDVTSPSATFVIERLASLTTTQTTGSNATGSTPTTGQPIMVRPRVAVAPNSLKRYVLVGTGRLLAESDITNNQVQSVYSIADGVQGFGKFKPISSPITPGDLEQNTNLLTGVPDTTNAGNGWYINLTETYLGSAKDTSGSSSSASSASSSSSSSVAATYAPRVLIDLEPFNGLLLVSIDRPSGEVCNMGGESTQIGVKFATGESILTDPDGNKVISTKWRDGMSANVAWLNVGDKVQPFAGTKKIGDVPKKVTGDFSAGLGLRRLNWREVPRLD